ncbi:MAG TPA: hypothetical protein VN418_01095 [Gammaproteobacteria bacterium]|nr:hypothetical protein [Gammaproteobacteria bacterium]
MAFEYVIVVFPTKRQVYIDDESNGHTNDKLRVDTGTHVFDLGTYANYAPESQTVLVEGTSSLEPMKIVFTRKVGN